MRCPRPLSVIVFLLGCLPLKINCSDLSLTYICIQSSTIEFSWRLDGNVTDTNYTISYSTMDNECFSVNNTIVTSDENYVLSNLHEGTKYSISIRDDLTGHTKGFNATTSKSVPSASPTSVKVTTDFIKITVQWEPVPCDHQNGKITGYSLRYGPVGANKNTKLWPVDGDSNTVTLEYPEQQNTFYSVEVAAVNDAGVGVYSEPEFINSINTATLDGIGCGDVAVDVSVAVNVSVIQESIITVFASISSDGWKADNFDIMWMETESMASKTPMSILSDIMPTSNNYHKGHYVTSLSYTITDLKSATNYSILVRANNYKKRYSIKSDIITVVTSDENGTGTEVDDRKFLAISFGVLGGIILILAVLLCCFCIYLRKVSKKSYKSGKKILKGFRRNTPANVRHQLSIPKQSVVESTYEGPVSMSSNQAYNRQSQNGDSVITQNEAYNRSYQNGFPEPRDPDTTWNEAYDPTSQDYDYVPPLPQPRNVISLTDPRDEAPSQIGDGNAVEGDQEILGDEANLPPRRGRGMLPIDPRNRNEANLPPQSADSPSVEGEDGEVLLTDPRDKTPPPENDAPFEGGRETEV